MIKQTFTTLLIGGLSLMAQAKELSPLQNRPLSRDTFTIGEKNTFIYKQKTDGTSINNNKPLSTQKNLATQKINLGTANGGGGDEIGLEFEKVLKNALNTLQTRDSASYNLLIQNGLQNTLKNIRYVVVEGPLQVPLEQSIQNSVAVNDRTTNIIYIHRDRWQKIFDVKTKEAIAIHEVASLLGLESTGSYPISSSYISGSVNTVCDSDKNEVDENGNEHRLRLTLQNLSTKERFLPSLAGISIENLVNGIPAGSKSEPLKDSNGNYIIYYGLRNIFKVQSLGEPPQATTPPSGPNSMIESPYLFTGERFKPETYQDHIYTQFILKSDLNGQVKLLITPSGQFGTYNSFHCYVK